MTKTRRTTRKSIVLGPGEGRIYDMGGMRSLFKADGRETASKYSISEWWLAPHSQGPGAHKHEEDDVFFVIEGTMSFLLGRRWVDASKGSFVLVPGGMKHTFENRTPRRTGALNFSVPGGFEDDMPAIVEWFVTRPLGKTK